MAAFSADFQVMKRRLAHSISGYIRPLFGSRMSSSVVKPPNVLIYHSKTVADHTKNSIEEIVTDCLPENRFAVYRLNYDKAITDPWMENCHLLVLPDLNQKQYGGKNFTIEDFYVLKTYFQNGGKILSFCQEFASNYGLNTTTIEKYSTFQIVAGSETLMPSVPKSWNGEVISMATGTNKRMDYNEVLYADSGVANSQVLAAMCVNENQGQLLHCSIPLLQFYDEFHAVSYASEDKILLKLLLGHLGYQNANGSMSSEKSTLPCYLFATSQHIMERFVAKVGKDVTGVKTHLAFFKVCNFASHEIPHTDTSEGKNYVPVLYCMDESSTNMPSVIFDWQKFNKNLKTKHLGQIVIYSDVVTSTMDIAEPIVGKLFHDKDLCVTCIARQQTSGKGRGGNKWLSPPGTAMFTIIFSMSLRSNLGQRLSILQHIMTVAVVHSIRSITGLENLDLRVKWPNDIYIGNSVKIGGVLVKSTIFADQCIMTIGCGVNVSNEYPTKCVNDAIKGLDPTKSLLSCEEVLALSISQLEMLIASFQSHGPAEFLRLYYKYWIHSDQVVEIRVKENLDSLVKAKITGIDDCGFLKATVLNGGEAEEIRLQPDSNSFDMAKNMIAMKS